MDASAQWHIPERFARRVFLHLAKNFDAATSAGSPLILGIHGPSGYGKTYQCELLLRQIGVEVMFISAGQLESAQAGLPAQLIRNSYRKAGLLLEGVEDEAPRLAAVLLNDVDLALGDWGALVQTTINRQTVLGELMHLSDFPTRVEGRKTPRIPIIVTGNDFTKLHGPLVRAGRMETFEWVPSLEERRQVVATIFQEITAVEVAALIEELEAFCGTHFGDSRSCLPPISFYSHLRSRLVDDALWTEIQQRGSKVVFDGILRQESITATPVVSYERLVRSGQELIQSGQLMDHLHA